MVPGKSLLNAVVTLLMATLPLDWLKPKGQKKFLRGLLAAAIRAASLNSASKVFRNCLSGRRLSELAAMMNFRNLRLACHKALQHGLKKILEGLLVDLAIDYTKIAYYGWPFRTKNEVIRRKAEHGTANHHAYASIYLILGGFRLTLAVIPVRRKVPLVDIVLALIKEASWTGIRIRRLLLDREFCTVPIQKALQSRHLAYCMAVKQTGKKSGVKAQVRRHRKRATKVKHTWEALDGNAVTADLYIVRRNARSGTGRTKTQYFTYAVWGFSLPPMDMKEFYRRRFGIESTYRMYDTIRGRTSSRNPTLRYLYVVVAFVILNQWALTKYATCAKRQRGVRTIDEDRLPLTVYVALLYRALEMLIGSVRDIVVEGTLPKWYSGATDHRR